MNILALDDTHRLVRARHGWFLANRFDHYLGAALIRYGECCEIEHQFLRSLLHAGDFVVEAGANIGIHSVGLAKQVGATGVVIPIEPQPEIFRVLCANLALNGLTNVMPCAVGCGERTESMVVPVHDYRSPRPHNSGAVSLLKTGTGAAVSIVPLDDLLEHISRIRLLKVDVEGMEREAVLGARKLIQKHRPLLYVENDRADNSKALIETIADMDYRLWWQTPSLFNPENYFAVKENDFPRVASFNMVCQPLESAAALPLPEITDSSEHPLAA